MDEFADGSLQLVSNTKPLSQLSIVGQRASAVCPLRESHRIGNNKICKRATIREAIALNINYSCELLSKFCQSLVSRESESFWIMMNYENLCFRTSPHMFENFTEVSKILPKKVFFWHLTPRLSNRFARKIGAVLGITSGFFRRIRCRKRRKFWKFISYKVAVGFSKLRDN